MLPLADRDAQNLLSLLADVLQTANPEDPSTFITYSQVLTRLGISYAYGHPGRILQERGLNSLAHWEKESGVPAVTGLIVRDKERDPGPGYFRFHGKRELDDIPWLIEQIRRSKQFDWSAYVAQKTAKAGGDLSKAAQPNVADPSLLDEASRIANLIFERVSISGTTVLRTAPQRTAPENLVANIYVLLQAKPLVCYLCSATMQIKAANRLLQPSPDRVDSSIDNYGPENLRLAHLACNLGKNAASVGEFKEWLSLLSKAQSEIYSVPR